MDKHSEQLEEHEQLMENLEGAPCMNCPEGEYQAGTTTRMEEMVEEIAAVRIAPLWY